jgi:F0F1-type ATP synthase beta subunit
MRFRRIFNGFSIQRDKSTQPTNQLSLSELQIFTGTPGKYVELKDTLAGFKGLVNGQYDSLPEMAFYMVGDISEVQAKADELAKRTA